MFTRNWYVALYSSAWGRGAVPRHIKSVAGKMVYPVNDNPSYRSAWGVFPMGEKQYIQGYVNTSFIAGVHFGSGTTTPTLDDYTLENRITSGLTCETLDEAIKKIEDNTVTVQNVYTLTNTSENEITVSEIGFFADCSTSTSVTANTGSSTDVLIDRTVLDTPVTIPAGGTGVVTYTLKYKLPAIPA